MGTRSALHPAWFPASPRGRVRRELDLGLQAVVFDVASRLALSLGRQFFGP
jgi:hypothetical protein